jgi:hypothetical protein
MSEGEINKALNIQRVSSKQPLQEVFRRAVRQVGHSENRHVRVCVVVSVVAPLGELT